MVSPSSQPFPGVPLLLLLLLLVLILIKFMVKVLTVVAAPVVRAIVVADIFGIGHVPIRIVASRR